MDKLINELAKLLEEKRNKLKSILDLTINQTEAIDKEDENILNQLIDKKQVAIDQIDVLDSQFTQKFDTLKAEIKVETLDEVTGNQAIKFKILKDELNKNNKVVEEIISREKENSVKLKKEYDDIKSKLREVSGSKRVISAYENKQTLTDGVYIDKKK